jgi:hypothetical protein
LPLALLLALALAPTATVAAETETEQARVAVVGSRAARVARALRRARVEAVASPKLQRRRGRISWGATARALDADWIVRLRWSRRRLSVRVYNAKGQRKFSRRFRRRRWFRRLFPWLMPRITLQRAAESNTDSRVETEVTVPTVVAAHRQETHAGVGLVSPVWARREVNGTRRQVAASARQGKGVKAASRVLPSARAEEKDQDPFAEEPGDDVRVAQVTSPASAPASAPAPTADAPREKPLSDLLVRRWGLPFRLAGDIWAHHISYLLDRDDQLVNSRNEVALRLSPGVRLGTAGRSVWAVVDGRARVDQSDPDRTEAFFSEAFVEAAWGPASLCLGQRLLGWGATDRFSPVDNLRQLDFRDPLDPEKRGLYLIRARVLLGRHLYIEGVWVPFFLPHMQPEASGVDSGGLLTSSSRWFVAPPMPVKPVAPEPIEDGPEWFSYAGRLGLSLDWLDLAASYLYGFVPIPHVAFEPPDTLVQSYHRRQVVGLDFQTVLGPLAVKGEGALTLTRDTDGSDPAVPDSYVTYVLQLEYRLARIASSNNSLRLTAQFVGDHDLAGDALPVDVLHPGRFLGGLTARWEYLDHTAVEVAGLSDVPDGYFVRVEVWHELVDGLRVEVGGAALFGSTSSFFGLFDRNHRIYTRLKYSF